MLSGIERFSPPLLNANTVMRYTVIEQINNLSKRGLLFIHAPAGYGKTTAVTLWSQGKNVVWLSLDEYSSSSIDIFKWLLSALSCEVSKDFMNAPLEHTLDSLQKSDKWPKAIIIDDFHFCTDSSVIRALPLIRARMPISTSFIILSRNPPPSILDEQIFKGKIKQLTDLQFTSNKIALLFSKNKIIISKNDAELLRKQTDGWAAVLAAIMIAQKDSFSNMFDRKTLNHYLKSYIFEYWDDSCILKKCSVVESLNLKLCEAITGQTGAWDVITTLADKTGLVSRLDDDTCRFHDLLRDFLFSELQLDENIDKSLLYKTAANWHKDNGDLIESIILAGKSGDISLMEDCLRLKTNEHGKRYVHMAGYVSAIIENIYPNVPKPIAKQSIHFSSSYSSSLFYSGRLQESFEWFDTIKELLATGKNSLSDLIDASLNLVLDPREQIWNLPIIFKNIVPPLTVIDTKSRMTRYIMSLDLPFYHKGQIDFADISPQFDGYLSRITEHIFPIIGSAFKPVFSLIEAGIRYERGELAEAEKIAGDVVQISNHFPPEMQFSSFVIHADILRVQGKVFDLTHIDSMINETNAHYLFPNFNAYTVNIKLQNGDTAAAAVWLAQADVESTLKFYKIYQYFTTARALMVIGKLSEAEILLERLVAFSQDYRRGFDYIEALTLQSICEWHMKRVGDAVKTIIQAITKATELQLVMPIAKENRDILPILQKVLNRLKYGYDADILDKSFVNTLFLKARIISKYSNGMFSKNKDKPVKLSPRQIEMLEYLRQNLSYREISNIMGVKIVTVDAHIRKLYEKLEVSNARDAVMKANELGIGNMA